MTCIIVRQARLVLEFRHQQMLQIRSHHQPTSPPTEDMVRVILVNLLDFRFIFALNSSHKIAEVVFHPDIVKIWMDAVSI